MRVRVKLYSILRDSMGMSELEVEIPQGSRVGDLIKLLLAIDGFKRAYEAIGGSLLIVDNEGLRLEEDSPINSNTIHVMPPPAGGSAYVEVGVLGESEELDVGVLEARLSKVKPNGAIAFFIGRVKEFNQGERVRELYYEHAGEILERVLRRIAEEEASKWGLSGVIIYHYVGRRRVGEMTIVVGVSGDSRRSVFPALAEIVERVKREAPIWKVEYRDSGAYYILGDRIIKVNLLKPSMPESSQPSS